MKRIKLIAEIGWNHMGNINLAEKMIIQASKADLISDLKTENGFKVKHAFINEATVTDFLIFRTCSFFELIFDSLSVIL